MGWQWKTHSNTPVTESRFNSKVLDFQRGERLGESISDHISSRAIDKSNFSIFDNPVDEVETDMYAQCDTGGPLRGQSWIDCQKTM